ncbi:MAG: hypothetical protein ACR2JY_00650 [Chloroflexota bacterium]
MKDEGWRARLIEQPRWHASVAQRYCQLHPAVRAVDRCDRCGDPFCAACLQEVERWRICAVCRQQFRREERAGRLPSRLRRVRSEIVAGISIVVVMALVVIGLQTLLRGSSSNAAMLRSAEIVGSKLNGAAAPRLVTLQMVGTAGADHPPATLEFTGKGFQAGEVVTVSAEVDGPGALLGPTQCGQDSVTWLGSRMATADGAGAVTVRFSVPDADHLPTPYRIQAHARGNRGATAAFSLHPGSG